ncbi:hypothetical protein IB690_01015, partial [Francisella orientalis]|nr:hypothetical protein [Francisella orientalis]
DNPEQSDTADQRQQELNDKEANKLLAVINDNPGGLLRNKFARDYQRMIGDKREN